MRQNQLGRGKPCCAAVGLIIIVMLSILAAAPGGSARAQDTSLGGQTGTATADSAHFDAAVQAEAHADADADISDDPLLHADEILSPTGEFVALEGSYPFISGDPHTSDTLNLESVQGKLVLLDFWASWCRPCIEEIPETNAFAAEFDSLENFVFISVNQDVLTSGGDADYVRDLVRERGIDFPVLIDHPSPSLKRMFAVRAWPTRIMISPDGELLVPPGGRLTLSVAAEYLRRR